MSEFQRVTSNERKVTPPNYLLEKFVLLYSDYDVGHGESEPNKFNEKEHVL